MSLVEGRNREGLSDIFWVLPRDTHGPNYSFFLQLILFLLLILSLTLLTINSCIVLTVNNNNMEKTQTWFCFIFSLGVVTIQASAKSLLSDDISTTTWTWRKNTRFDCQRKLRLTLLIHCFRHLQFCGSELMVWSKTMVPLAPIA